MKLRNKKTGEIIECPMIRMSIGVCDLMRYEFPNSLAELNEEWEDYKPTEPLIEDEEIRKAIQVWAEANEYDSTTMLKYDEKNGRFSTITSQIEFDNCQPFDRLEDGATYTIAELCGEEE